MLGLSEKSQLNVPYDLNTGMTLFLSIELTPRHFNVIHYSYRIEFLVCQVFNHVELLVILVYLALKGLCQSYSMLGFYFLEIGTLGYSHAINGFDLTHLDCLIVVELKWMPHIICSSFIF